MKKIILFLPWLAVVALGVILLRQQSETKPVAKVTAVAPTTQAVTVAEAEAFMKRAEKSLQQATEQLSRTQWVYMNFITDDTAKLAAAADERLSGKVVSLITEAKRFDDLELPAELARKFKKLKMSLTLPPPDSAEQVKALAEISADLGGMYAKGRYCFNGSDCKNLGELSQILAAGQDEALMKEAWVGWREVAKPMREPYRDLVDIANAGSQALGFADTGDMWRSNYDMPPEDFAEEMDRLWGQVEPLYKALHCHARAKLNNEFGDDVVDPQGPIPAHLLGNMWAQSWENIYDKIKPATVNTGFDLTQRLRSKRVSEIEMVRIAEKFFTSLGFKPLPDSFWERSLFTRPQDRDVECHASAWNIDDKEDLRIKMCINVNSEDFGVIHHELGHNFYQRAYNHLSTLHRGSANDGFHEAVGDTIALSITPEYLKEINFIDAVPDPGEDVGLLLQKALEKVAFLPFGLLVDQWRWQVFNGDISPEDYNAGWWQLREKYQGVKAPVERNEDHFDPGAKYHIPGNTPYSRYFLAHILQFQFHRELCKLAEFKGPLHRCTIYDNKKVGEKFKAMLAMGASQPWQDALEAMTGSREMDATAILDYFAPLKIWLDEQNKGRQCGWGSDMGTSPEPETAQEPKEAATLPEPATDAEAGAPNSDNS